MNAPAQAICPIHQKQSVGPCSRCGTFVCSDCLIAGQGLTCAKCRALGAVARVPTPWERRAEIGALRGLWETWKLAMFKPDPFFRSVQPDGRRTFHSHGPPTHDPPRRAA